MESRCSCTPLKERDPGEPPAKHCGETAVLPDTGGAGAATQWLLSGPLPHVATWKVCDNLKWLFPKESFKRSGNIASYCLLGETEGNA